MSVVTRANILKPQTHQDIGFKKGKICTCEFLHNKSLLKKDTKFRTDLH